MTLSVSTLVLIVGTGLLEVMMMSKRFMFDPSINHFTDTETDKIYCEYNLDKVTDLLNSYDNELETYKSGNRTLQLRLKEVKEENIALKSSNMEYEDALGRLEEENKELKQQSIHFESEMYSEKGNGEYYKQLFEALAMADVFLPYKHYSLELPAGRMLVTDGGASRDIK